MGRIALANIVIVMLMLMLDRMFESEGSLRRSFHESSREAELAHSTWKKLTGALYRIERHLTALSSSPWCWAFARLLCLQSVSDMRNCLVRRRRLM
jgi:hypothetical protein